MKELNDNGVISALRKMYRQSGYQQYYMGKFEEYDLYARNKDFLVSEGVITFNDTDGRLLALKPDVTLSIIKNGTDGEAQKVFYDENVYRVSGSTRSFREFRQLGLECIGDIDTFSVFEVLELCLKTLKTISRDYVLDISHSGIVTTLLEGLNLSKAESKKALKAISGKNVYELREMLEDSNDKRLIEVVSLSGSPKEVLPRLKDILGDTCTEAVLELEALSEALCDYNINIDFSVEGNMSYYNGIIFKGFIKGVPESVLSGGRYDPLLRKMHRKSGAIGFAVYLDALERLWSISDEGGLDAVLLYSKTDSISAVNNALAYLRENGKRVAAFLEVPKNIKYRKLLKLEGNGVAFYE